VRDLQDLVLNDREHLVGRDLGERRGNRVEQPGDRDEADNRDEKEQRREERQEKIVGQLRSETEAVVDQDLAARSLRELPPTSRAHEPTKHQLARGRGVTPVPTAVHAGASLAGKESADA